MLRGIFLTERIKSFILVFGLVILGLAGFGQNAKAATSRTYTLDAEFDEGILVGVEHETYDDQLQLSQEPVTLPFIWVPNNDGTVSKVHTETGKELGRYRVAPHSDCSPSRTTVDLDGSCYVGNRQAGTVVKIGLYEAGQCVDRNGNGTIETSKDLNDDGDITGAEILPWGQDECVLYEVVLISGSEGTYVPGSYDGVYDTDFWGTSPRGLAVDASNNLWAGTWSSPQTYYYIDGPTGTILDTLDPSDPPGHNAYVAVIDGIGVLWSLEKNGEVRSFDLNGGHGNDIIYLPGWDVYGLGLDYDGHLFALGVTLGFRIIISSGLPELLPPSYPGMGVACTSDNNFWVASTNDDKVYRYDHDGNDVTAIDVGGGPAGVAVDAAGKVWVCNLDNTIIRIDPTTNAVDLTKAIVGSGGHYGNSDMTGIIARNVTTKIGTWTVVFDSLKADTPWGTISWNSDEPADTSVTVKARSSNDLSTWSAWESATNGVPLISTTPGRYLEVETRLQMTPGEVSPILNDLTVESANEPPIADPNGPYLGAADEPCPLDGTGSFDPEGDPLSWEWDCGDGTPPETGEITTHTYSLAGIYDVCLTVEDLGLLTDNACTYAVIYDPSAGFVTGGGWIESPPGAYVPDDTLTGKANFGFVSKYKKGATSPTGNTEFQFQTADLNFHSDSYDWLVVTGSGYAMFKGAGTINGMGDYKFKLWAGDREPDTFRIKIWWEDDLDSVENVVYDNGTDQSIDGGSIVIHTSNK